MSDDQSTPAARLRLVAELTQSQAAALVGVSVRTWRNWESGSIAMPAAKAQAFKDAVLALDRSTIESETGEYTETGMPPSMAAAWAALNRPHPPMPWWGKKADGTLDECNAERVERYRSAPWGTPLPGESPGNDSRAESESEFEPLTSDGVGDEMLAGLLDAMRATKAVQ